VLVVVKTGHNRTSTRQVLGIPSRAAADVQHGRK
jgi:hypothetical protein